MTNAIAKAHQVQRRVSCDTSVTFEPPTRPRSLRSISATVPITVVMAITWTASRVGNTHSDETMCWESGQASMACASSWRFTVTP